MHRSYIQSRGTVSLVVRAFVVLFLSVNFFAQSLAAAPDSWPKEAEQQLNISPKGGGIISAVASYIIRPIIIDRIDFLLNKNNAIDAIKKMRFDSKIIGKLDTDNGEGDICYCGQKVTINLKAMSMNKIMYERQQYANVLGDFDIRALNIGITGMKVGGKRVIYIPRAAANELSIDSLEDAPIEYSVELLKVEPAYPKEISQAMVFTEMINNHKAAMCGDVVDVHYTVRDLTGNPLQDEHLKFKIGDTKAPLAIELFAIEMQPGASRTIIAPPALLGEIADSQDSKTKEARIIDMQLTAIG